MKLVNRKYGRIFIIFSLLFTLAGCARQQEEEKAYREVLISTGELITKMASACISHARSYINIREYARVTGEDFDAVAEKILGKEYQELEAQLKASKLKIDEFMEGLNEPPSSLVEIYGKLFELHALYSKIHDLAVNPSGSIEEYSDSINDLESRMNDLKSKLDALYVR
jgi:chromosome segregation ATPase